MTTELQDLEPPKSPMTIYKWMEILEKENDRQLNELRKELNEFSEKTAKECKELKEELLKALGDFPKPQIEKNDHIEEIAQLKKENGELKKENADLKKENSSLRTQLQQLLASFKAFFEKKIASASENWSSFFAKKKDCSSDSAINESSNSFKL